MTRDDARKQVFIDGRWQRLEDYVQSRIAATSRPPAEAQPEPNWCRTCGRRPHDPVAALCPDTHHRKASPPSEPVGVDWNAIGREEILPSAEAVGRAFLESISGRGIGYSERNLLDRAAALAQQPAAVDIEELRRALCVIGVAGKIDGHDVIRRDSMLDIIDRRRSALAAQPQKEPQG